MELVPVWPLWLELLGEVVELPEVPLWPLGVELLGELFGSCPVGLLLLVPVCDVLLLGVVDDVCARAKTAHSSRNIVVNINFFMNHIPPGPVVF